MPQRRMVARAIMPAERGSHRAHRRHSVSADRVSPIGMPSFGPLLRRYREAAGLTQEELAVRASLSARGISDLERGRRQTPRLETVRLLAEALALRVAPGELLDEQVPAFLRERRMLLVLDNFEHLLPAATFVATLLTVCPHLKALVTSREPLKIGGEHELPVAPLDDEAAHELFMSRARASHPALDTTAGDLAAAEAICRRGDRLPPAISRAALRGQGR